MKKKSILNIIMVLVIVLIAVCGFMAVRTLTGPSSDDGALQMSIQDKSGIVTVERNGIAYEVEEDTAVRAGDILRTKMAAQLSLNGAMGTIVLGENTEMVVGESDFSLTVGELFADGRAAQTPAAILTEGGTVAADKAVLTVTAQPGSQTVYVYSGSVSVSGEAIAETLTANAGERISIVKNTSGEIKAESTAFTASALSDRQIQSLQNCAMDDSFCFTDSDLTEVLKLRQEEKEKAQQAQLLLGEQAKDALAQEQAAHENAQTTQPNSTTVITETPQGTTQSGTQGNTQSGVQSGTQGTTQSGNTQSTTQNNTQSGTQGTTQSGSTGSTTTSQQKYVTIEIRCDTILNNMGNLTPGKEAYVPGNGIILSTSKIEFTEGETVFEVLQRACSRAGIQLEYRYTPIYGSYYIEGINQLYEFDCGDESGWMYKVNGWFPNYGCSSYKLQEGDTIVWCYTCNGLGADVGGSNLR